MEMRRGEKPEAQTKETLLAFFYAAASCFADMTICPRVRAQKMITSNRTRKSVSNPAPS
jgi:hypothetical protein